MEHMGRSESGGPVQANEPSCGARGRVDASCAATPPPGRRPVFPEKIKAIAPVFFALTVLLASCAKEKKAVERPGAPVTVAKATTQDVPVELDEVGSVEAVSTISVKSQVSGKLKEVRFKEGQYVKKGELLFVIDPLPFEMALREAEAALARDSARLDTASKDYERDKALIKGGYITPQQYDQAENNAKSLDASVKADRAAIEAAKIDLAYCYIHSPIEGRTGSILMTLGNIIKANDDKPMVVIYQLHPIYVSFPVPEKYLNGVKRLSRGRRLEVTASAPPPASGPLAGVGGWVSKGALTFIDNAVDTSTGTIMLKGTFANRDDLLWPGQFVNAVLKLYVQKGAVVVPARAVQTGQKGEYVFVIKPDNTAEERGISAGVSFGPEGSRQTVIEKGVNAGDTVVTDGQLQLMTGAKVEIVGRAGTGAQSAAGTPAESENGGKPRGAGKNGTGKGR